MKPSLWQALGGETAGDGGVLVTGAVMGFNLLGDGLRSKLFRLGQNSNQQLHAPPKTQRALTNFPPGYRRCFRMVSMTSAG